MEKILVTGGAGYIGSVLIPELLKKGSHVTLVDKFIFKQKFVIDPNFKNRIKIIKDDVRNHELMKKILKDNFDYIIPLAALVGAPLCDKFKKEAKQINLDSIKFLIDNCDINSKIILPTTNSGYGIGLNGIACDETSPLNPISLYGTTKVDSEKYLVQRGNYISLRLATVFGMSPRMRIDLLVNNFVNEAITKKYIEIFEGKFKRNYVHINDVASVFIFSMENFNIMKNNIFNFGLENVNLTKIELANKIKEYVPDFKYVLNEFTKDPDKRDYIISNQKILKTGYRFKFSLEDGIKQLIDGLKDLSKDNLTNIIDSI